MSQNPFPAVDPALISAPLPEPIAQALAQREPQNSARADIGRLLWTRDLRPWERRAALVIWSRGGPRLAGDFICCGLTQYGHLAPAAPLREALRAVHLRNYLASAIATPTPSNIAAKPSRPLALVRLALGSLLATVFSPCSVENTRDRFTCAAALLILLTLPAAGFAFSLALAPLALASGAIARSFGQGLSGTSNGQNRVMAFPLLARARASGLHGRVRAALDRPPLIINLLAIGQRDDPLQLDQLSGSVRSRMNLDDFELSKNPSSWRESLALGEALDLERSLGLPRPAPSVLKTPSAALFSRLARRLAPPEEAKPAAPKPASPPRRRL